MALLDLQGLNKLVNILHLRLSLMPAGTRGQLQQVLMPAENGNIDQISAEALLVSPSSISSISQPTPTPQTAATCSRRHPPTLPFRLDLLASATPLLTSTTDGRASDEERSAMSKAKLRGGRGSEGVACRRGEGGSGEAVLQLAATNISTGVATVDCQKQVRSWRLLRAIMEFRIPNCNCIFFEEDTDDENSSQASDNYQRRQQPPYISSSSTTITITLFGYRYEKVRFCIQTNSKSSADADAALLLLFELAVSTTTLAREMHGGVLRIALESKRKCLWERLFSGRRCGT
nr:protein MIZU-KUSSEI 1-like [Ipomoea batatas]